MEETGFDIKDLIEPSQFLVHENLGNNHMKLYIVPGVPEDTQFMPQSRKEISVCVKDSFNRLSLRNFLSQIGNKKKILTC